MPEQVKLPNIQSFAYKVNQAIGSRREGEILLLRQGILEMLNDLKIEAMDNMYNSLPDSPTFVPTVSQKNAIFSKLATCNPNVFLSTITIETKRLFTGIHVEDVLPHLDRLQKSLQNIRTPD